MNTILVTGVAGFIGFHVASRMLQEGYTVIGIDNVNDYYDTQLKRDRLRLLESPSFTFYEHSIEDCAWMNHIFSIHHPHKVIHLAAQAGVGNSTKNPMSYVHSNLLGYSVLLECCRQASVSLMLYASSSSVYGANKKTPFSVADRTDHPLTLYAATKKANELMAYTYSHMYGLPTIGLRFFTVYGPWGRPDMSLFKFTDAIIRNQPLQVYNYGKSHRDFTYIDDIVESIFRLVNKGPNTLARLAERSEPPHKVYNIGSTKPVKLLEYIRLIEEFLGMTAKKELLPLQKYDVPDTFANVEELVRDIDYRPATPIDRGIETYIRWFKSYYRVKEIITNEG